MLKLGRYAAIMSLLLGSGLAQATSFYFGAHADDVELFMGRNAAYDVQSKAKVVFVVMTTGSYVGGETNPAVQGAGIYPGVSNPMNNPYYITRERGHAASLRYWFGLTGTTPTSDNTTNVVIDGKTIQRTEIGTPGSNVIMYNIRLIDGFEDKSGFYWFRNQSITNPNITISSVDGVRTFTWYTLKTFLRALIGREQDANDTWVNIPEFYAGPPPFAHPDHYDHYATGLAVSHALQDYANSSPARCIRTIQWVGYFSSATNENVTPPKYPWPTNYTTSEKATQFAAWDAHNNGMVAAGGPDTRNAGHTPYLYRMYASSNAPSGVTKFGPCP
ncbi:hypothetical protein [Burkholderia sp. LMU1-1-1.1]|uniref:hypothetical protein n=1 Tax=Burkholderia sp. LMU1-1-1.1 TaxID=3135266 RepID=UPI00342446C6